MTDPRQHATAIAVSLALLTTGEHAIAQGAAGSGMPEMESRLEVGALTTNRTGAVPTNAFSLTPSVRFADARFTASARVSAWIGEQNWQLGNSTAELEAFTPLLYGVRAEVAANASRLFFDPTLQNDEVGAQARLHYMRQRGGIWLGSGISRPLRVTAVQNVNVSSGGAWTRVGPTTIRGSVTSFFFTKVSNADTAAGAVACQTAHLPTATTESGVMFASMRAAAPACRYQSRLTDLEASVRYERSFMEVTVRGGERFGDPFDVSPESRQWASAQAAVWISNQMAAVAGGGREPAQPTRGLPARSYGTLGLMLAYWPIPRGSVPVETPANLIRAFEFRPAGSTVQRITARIGGVESVEIMGDFSDWTAMPLIRRGRDQWELLIPMSPGVHQINLRIDGGQWIAPPGVPTVNDGFSGEVGVLVVKP